MIRFVYMHSLLHCGIGYSLESKLESRVISIGTAFFFGILSFMMRFKQCIL